MYVAHIIPMNSDSQSHETQERKKKNVESGTRQEVLSACWVPGTVLGAVLSWACLHFLDQKSPKKLSTINYSVGGRTKAGVIPKPVFFRAAITYVG